VSELYLLLLASVALVVAGFVSRPPTVFTVDIRHGLARTRRGTVTDAFLSVVTDICREFDVTTADIRGVARGSRIALQFSASVPESARQRFRNWWAMSGWSATSRSRR
jgi:hypothetical protein